MPKIPENQCPQNVESSDFVRDIVKKLTYDCRFKEWPVPQGVPRGTGRKQWAGGRQPGGQHVPGDRKTTQAAQQEAPQTTLDDTMSVKTQNNKKEIGEIGF